MKLFEIIMLESINLDKVTPVKFGKGEYFPISGDIIGDGTEAQVHRSRAGVVTKMANIEWDPDPAIEFVKLAVAHQDNPFFPKIYHARLYRDKTGKQWHKIMVVQMEELHPLDNKEIKKHIPELFQQIGISLSDKEQESAQQEHEKYKNDKWADPTSLELSRYTLKLGDLLLDSDGIEQLAKESKNPKFVEAARLLAPYFDEYESDMHSGNVMVRKTPNGLQLVIIDPFEPLKEENW